MLARIMRHRTRAIGSEAARGTPGAAGGAAREGCQAPCDVGLVLQPCQGFPQGFGRVVRLEAVRELLETRLASPVSVVEGVGLQLRVMLPAVEDEHRALVRSRARVSRPCRRR